jgi:glycosyltransferase involved in cell wall biosynthesis
VIPEKLAQRLVRDAILHLERGVASFMPDFSLPAFYGGHPVGSDVRADLAFTLGHLWSNGVREVAGVPVPEALRRILAGIDGPSTHTFFSYRTAETLALFGPWQDNAILASATKGERENLALACDSTASVTRLRTGHLPRNYAAVLARCEVARRRLGLPHDGPLLEELLALTRHILAEQGGPLDDSQGRLGRYDLYSADVYLFCEPLSELLAPVWQAGIQRMLEIVRKVASEDGSAMAWGRSTGALGVCHTVELGALALARGLTESPEVWLALAANAASQLEQWFSGGVTTAHQHRSCDSYRGPARRLQLTFDLLGKMAEAARHLRAAPPVEEAPWREAFPDRDELVWFDQQRRAFVWSYRSDDLAFVLPVTGCTTSDYLPAPRSPGLFETPASSSDQAVAVPYVLTRSGRYVGAGLPGEVAKSAGALRLVYDGWRSTGEFDDVRSKSLAGERAVDLQVQGPLLSARESLRFSEAPLAIGLQLAEVKGRPLSVRCDPPPASACQVNTAGMAEWRSFWGELPLVHQMDLKPARELTFSWSVKPLLRVMVSPNTIGHHYHRAIYDPLSGDVAEQPLPSTLPRDANTLAGLLRSGDIFHLHWPEWFPGMHLEAHLELIGALKRAQVAVLWTMHNLLPHNKLPVGEAIYGAWAGVVDAVAHHSEWGRAQALARYSFRSDAVHQVVPHPHFGHLAQRPAPDRREVEQALGLRHGVLRLAVLGAPRREKRVDVVVEAVRACRRTDLEVLVALGPDEPVPEDPRIRAFPYSFSPRDQYDRLLRAADALILPFEPHGMLTTGQVGDVVGYGLPAIVSDWAFLGEVLGEAAICYGQTAEDLARCLDGLQADQLAQAAARSEALRSAYAPQAVAGRLLSLLRTIRPRHGTRPRGGRRP